MLVLLDPIYEKFVFGMMPGMVEKTGGIPGNPGATQGVGNLKEVEKIRSDFPETWLWTNTTIG